MDYALEEWEKTIQGRDVEDKVYSFAYWFFRWSGLIQPIEKQIAIKNEGRIP